MTSILGQPVLEWVFWINVGVFTAVIQYLMWRRIFEKENQKALSEIEKKYQERKALLKVLSCDECGIRVDGHADGWHDHSKHGELTVCIDCSDSCGYCGWGEPCECEEIM